MAATENNQKINTLPPPSVSIMTASYNRAELLSELYLSMCAQKCRDFEWIIIDDGSCDQTRKIIKTWQYSTVFPIHYIYQENGGKQSALNRGIEEARAELVLIIDSDDLLESDAIGNIVSIWKTYSPLARDRLSGIFCAMHHKGVVRKMRRTLVDEVVSPKQQFDRRKEFDYMPAIRRDILLRNRFPVCEGEKFIAEGALWNKISLKWGCLFMNSPLATCRYQANGVSANSLALRKRWIKGTLLYYSNACDSELGFFNTCRARCNYYRFVRHALKQNSPGPFNPHLFWFRFFGLLLYWKDSIKRGG